MPSFGTPGYPTSILAKPIDGGKAARLSVLDKQGNVMAAHLDTRRIEDLIEYLNTLLDATTEPMPAMSDDDRIALADKLHEAIEDAIWDDSMKAEPYEPLEDHRGDSPEHDSDTHGKKHQPRPQPEITHLSTCASENIVYTTAALADGRIVSMANASENTVYTTATLDDGRILSMANIAAEWFDLPPILSRRTPR